MQTQTHAETRPPVPPAPFAPSADELLVEALMAGSEPAYELLVDRYGGRMLAVARRLLRDEHEAQDAVQEAFLSAFRNLGGFRRGAQLGTWLHRITVNAALMRLRRRASRPEVGLVEDVAVLEDRAEAAGWCPDPLPDPESDLLTEETRRRVRESIDRLPAPYRTVLMLRDIEELDTAEVAVLLGITANAVKIRLHRARQALTAVLCELRPAAAARNLPAAARIQTA